MLVQFWSRRERTAHRGQNWAWGSPLGGNRPLWDLKHIFWRFSFFNLYEQQLHSTYRRNILFTYVLTNLTTLSRGVTKPINRSRQSDFFRFAHPKIGLLQKILIVLNTQMRQKMKIKKQLVSWRKVFTIFTFCPYCTVKRLNL